MNRKYLSVIVLPALISLVLLSSCWESIDQLSTFNFRFPLFFQATYRDKVSPDTSMDFVNLYEYDQYKDNIEKISKAEIIAFNYRIDSLIFTDKTTGSPVIFNPILHKNKLEYENIKFYLIFARPKDTLNIHSLDSADFEVDPTQAPILLGEFKNVKIEDYYRFSHYIETIEDEIARTIDKALREQPQFYIVTMYSKMKDQDLTTEPERVIPLISSRYDLIIRFSVDL